MNSNNRVQILYLRSSIFHSRYSIVILKVYHQEDEDEEMVEVTDDKDIMTSTAM